MRFSLALLFALMAGVPGLATVRAQSPAQVPHDDDPPGYRATVAEGLREFDAHNYQEARSLFLRSHALSPSARTHRALGLVEFELRNYVDSIHHLRAALDSPEKPLSEVQYRETADVLARAQAFVGRFRVRTSPASAKLWLDGSQLQLRADEPLLIAMGEHSLECKAAGHLQKQQRLSIKGGEIGDLSFELVPVTEPTGAAASSAGGSARAWYKNGWLWAAVGIVVVGAAAGGTSYALLRDDKSPKPIGGTTSTVLAGP